MGQSRSRNSPVPTATGPPGSPPPAPDSPPVLGPGPLDMLDEPETQLEASLLHIVRCFHLYAAREGDVETLSLRELRALLCENLPCFMAGLGRREPFCTAQLFQAADRDGDQQICFDEFLYVLGKLVKDYHLRYHRQLCAQYCARHGLY